MATDRYFKRRSKWLAMSQQHLRMSALHPQFKLAKLKPSVVIWQGRVQPLPLSETYDIRITYVRGRGPGVLVISPALTLLKGEVSIPHTFVGNYLCLYYRDYEEWSPQKYVAETIVPWISLWLMYYEAWLATGEWLGGGIKHEPAGKRRV